VRLLLDTHTFLWWLDDDTRLGAETRKVVAHAGNIVFVSAATAWEIAIKRALGKLTAPGAIPQWIRESGFDPLSIEVEHAAAAAELPPHHKDPFGRILVAQAQLEELMLVTHDAELDEYDVAVHHAGV
jgi:PIN domain nuclease of toxin-antitoxin system